MQELIDRIVDTEWTMFHSTQNKGGPASCQNDRRQFEIMRTAQFLVWNEPLLRSYEADLLNAVKQGQNLISFKYAYMMQYSSPEEYQTIQHLLPAVSAKKLSLIDTLSQKTVQWAEQFSEKYPHLAGLGRPIHAYDDRPGFVSMETYSRGEWMTYSESTLQCLVSYYEQLSAEGRNIQEEILAQELALSGLGTPEQTEQKLAQARR